MAAISPVAGWLKTSLRLSLEESNPAIPGQRTKYRFIYGQFTIDSEQTTASGCGLQVIITPRWIPRISREGHALSFRRRFFAHVSLDSVAVNSSVDLSRKASRFVVQGEGFFPQPFSFCPQPTAGYEPEDREFESLRARHLSQWPAVG
jgi:hypothetical protein